jgi:choline dehydrogenase-like flavoprotein
MELKPKHKELLIALADTFVASFENDKDSALWQFRGSNFATPDRIVEVIDRQPGFQQKEFFQLLNLLSSPLLGFTWTGPFKPFLKLNANQREELLRSWSDSNREILRKGFQALKKLICFLAYSTEEANNAHPAFVSLGYPGVMKEDIPSQAKPKLPTMEAPESGKLVTQVLVIGSGAGGGVIASELAKAGLDVLVVEKGSYVTANELTQSEGQMVKSLYELGGAISSKDGSMTLLAGSCLGGGTTVNWAGAFRTPDYVLEEWAKKHHNPFFLQESYQKSLDAVSDRMGVSTQYHFHNPQNMALLSGSEALGHHPRLIPRNDVNNEGDQRRFGFSCLGDKYGDKKGSIETFLQDAVAKGARILPNTEIQKITTDAGTVTGAIATVRNSKGELKTITISAERVFVCAGAIHTPALLIRSGLVHKYIGLNLHLHPTVVVSGIYPHKMESWYGPMMSVVNDHFTRMKGNYGFKLETPPTHIGQIAMALPWSSAEEHKNYMLKTPFMGNFIVLTRDKYAGRIALDPKGRPYVKYALSAFDKENLITGMAEASKIHLKAGADEVWLPHQTGMKIKEQDINESLRNQIANLGWDRNRFMLFSAHQMGTCRMGGSDKLHPVKANGETREVRKLYIADASCFPSASGANPMLSIMAIAHHIAKELVG